MNPTAPASESADLLDVLIVGGGLVGSSLACALDRSPLRVALVEASAPRREAPASFDERNLALNRLSLDALDALGVLARLDSPPVPIRGVHVSSAGDFGRVRLHAREHGVEAFGGVVVARELGQALQRQLGACARLQHLTPARVIAAEREAEAIRVELDGGRVLRARLLVIAEGTDSALRESLGLGATRKDYSQTLFVSVVEADRAHEGVAYERFTADGPVAMLPLSGTRVGSVLTVPTAEADATLALDDAAYLDLLQQRFGWRLGRLRRVGRRSAYPMRLVTANALVGPRCVVVGNAAQTLHPIGAQGFNLGLRDALTLAGLLLDCDRTDCGSAGLLSRHAALRAADRARTIDFSDGLADLFTHGAAPVRWLRGLGLAAFDHFGDLARPLVRAAMGAEPAALAALARLRRSA
jgi:2-octaprenyl-6-methoxyphenol hydroxylase